MDNLKLFNGMIGKTLTDVNTETEDADEITKIMDMTFDEAIQYLKGMADEWPPAFRKLKLSTLCDIVLNIANEETVEDLKKYFDE